MQIRVFAIPMGGDDEAIEELNRFLRGQKVLCVEKVAVVDHGLWCTGFRAGLLVWKLRAREAI